MSEIEEIKRLPPEERVMKLKEMEAERKKEIEEAESLMRDSFREIEEVQGKKHAPIKQVTADDISQLLTQEEKDIFRTARFETGGREERRQNRGRETQLEEVAEEGAKGRQHESRKPLYGQALDEARKGIDYGARITTTGAEARRGEGVEEIYSSRTVTGEETHKPMYQRQEVEERTSGMYGRKDKRRESWEL